MSMSVKKYLDRLEDLSNKEIIVTGGTSGIGLSIVKHLLYKNAKVVVLARNVEKFNDIKSQLLKDYPSAQLSCIKYDQSDNQCIKDAVQEIVNRHPEFYAVILNAGLIQTKKNNNLYRWLCHHY